MHICRFFETIYNWLMFTMFEMSWFSCGFSDSTVYFLLCLSVRCPRNAQKQSSPYSYSHKQTVQYTIVKIIGLISSHNAVYAFDLGIYWVSKQGLIYPLILPKVIFSAVVIGHISYALIIVWNLLSCETRTKRKKKYIEIWNGFLQDVGCSERCGVKFCFPQQQQLGKYNHFSRDPALYMKVFYCRRRRHVPQSILWLYLDCRSPILYWELFQNTVCAVVH